MKQKVTLPLLLLEHYPFQLICNIFLNILQKKKTDFPLACHVKFIFVRMSKVHPAPSRAKSSHHILISQTHIKEIDLPSFASSPPGSGGKGV